MFFLENYLRFSGLITNFLIFSPFQPEKLNVYKNDSDISWDYTLGEYANNFFYDSFFCVFFAFIIGIFSLDSCVIRFSNFLSQTSLRCFDTSWSNRFFAISPCGQNFLALEGWRQSEAVIDLIRLHHIYVVINFRLFFAYLQPNEKKLRNIYKAFHLIFKFSFWIIPTQTEMRKAEKLEILIALLHPKLLGSLCNPINAHSNKKTWYSIMSSFKRKTFSY